MTDSVRHVKYFQFHLIRESPTNSFVIGCRDGPLLGEWNNLFSHSVEIDFGLNCLNWNEDYIIQYIQGNTECASLRGIYSRLQN